MTVQTPEWAPFDAATPPELPGADAGAGRVVALVASSAASSTGWTGEVTASLVRAWSAAGLRLVVADAGLERPSLHDAFDVPNEEGLADALLWGASVQRVARPLTNDGFYVITAGTPVPDGAAAFEGERWGQLCTGFREAGVTLVALVRDGASGWERVVGAATDVFVLAGPTDDVARPTGLAAAKVRGVFGYETDSEPAPPPEAVAAGPAEPTEAGDGGSPTPFDRVDDAGSRADPVEASWRDPRQGPLPDAPVSIPALPEEEDRVEDTRRGKGSDAVDPLAPVPAPEPVQDGAAEREVPPTRGPQVPLTRRAAKPEATGRRWLLWAALVVAAIVAAILLGLGGFSSGDSGEGSASSDSAMLQAAPASGVLAAASTPRETSEVQGFSVAIGSYQDGAVARRRARALAGRVPGVIVAAVPIELDGTVYHRILATPARDSADASRLAGTVARAAGLDPSPWVLRPTSRAFRLDEMEDLESARRRVDVLVELDVPAYVLAVDYGDGSTRYRVYAGAYADEAEAAHLSGLLRERGLTTATLSDRIGRLPE